jgi:hypothetical protein
MVGSLSPTNYPTPLSRTTFGKLTVAQLVKTFLAFYGTPYQKVNHRVQNSEIGACLKPRELSPLYLKYLPIYDWVFQVVSPSGLPAQWFRPIFK